MGIAAICFCNELNAWAWFPMLWVSSTLMLSVGLRQCSASVLAMLTRNGCDLSTQQVEFSSILIALANTPLDKSCSIFIDSWAVASGLAF